MIFTTDASLAMSVHRPGKVQKDHQGTQRLLLMGKLKFVCTGCSFVQHATQGAYAAVALVSWATASSSLHLAMLLQPVQPPLPMLRQPELQQWHTTTLGLMQHTGLDQQQAQAHLPAPAAAAAADGGAAVNGEQEDYGISAVLHAWHPTGFCLPILLDLVVYVLSYLQPLY